MKFILAKKEGMTRVFGDDGRAYAGTILTADPVIVTQVKTKDGKDKYSAIQVGVGTRKTKNISKAVLGHTKGKGYTDIREMRLPAQAGGAEGAAVGDTIDASVFAVGDVVQVSGISKGKGFSGVVKRHGFHGGRAVTVRSTRNAPGLYRRLGRSRRRSCCEGHEDGTGRLGTDRVTVTNLKVLLVDKKEGKIIVSGAVPGRRGTLLEVVSA